MTKKKLSDDKPLPSEELVDEMDQKGRDQPDQMHGLLWVVFVLTFILPMLLLIWLWIQV